MEILSFSPPPSYSSGDESEADGEMKNSFNMTLPDSSKSQRFCTSLDAPVKGSNWLQGLSRFGTATAADSNFDSSHNCSQTGTKSGFPRQSYANPDMTLNRDGRSPSGALNFGLFSPGQDDISGYHWGMDEAVMKSVPEEADSPDEDEEVGFWDILGFNNRKNKAKREAIEPVCHIFVD